LLSTTLAGRLPSWVLAVTADPEGVISVCAYADTPNVIIIAAADSAARLDFGNPIIGSLLTVRHRARCWTLPYRRTRRRPGMTVVGLTRLPRYAVARLANSLQTSSRRLRRQGQSAMQLWI
jgi:hypothetical protein